MKTGLRHLLGLIPESTDFETLINALSPGEIYEQFRASGELNFIKYLQTLEKEYEIFIAENIDE